MLNWGCFRLNLLISIILSFTMSPLWPLGENPLIGDPYIIINKQTNQLAFIRDGIIQEIYTVSTGRTPDLTPEGEHNIIVKAINPYYRRGNIFGGNPDNPLGTRWLGFDANGTNGRIYGIHGTNNEWTIGKYVTNGCIRMKNKEVENLFEKIPIGTKVLIVNTDKSFLEIAILHGAISR